MWPRPALGVLHPKPTLVFRGLDYQLPALGRQMTYAVRLFVKATSQLNAGPIGA